MGKSVLYNRGSKKFVAKLLSDYKKNIIFTKNDFTNIIYKYDKSEIVFYENKKTKKRVKKCPKDYSPSKYRKFTDVKEPRKTALKKLNSILSELSIPDYVFAKTDGGYVKNGKFHKGSVNFLLIDIASFYPSCKFIYVKRFFMSGGGLKLKQDLAQVLSELVTVPSKDNHRHRVVPQGFPTSTIISFLAYRIMFAELNKLALKHDLKFSTYVDDVTFSTKDENFDYSLIIKDIQDILKKYGHKMKEEKTQVCLLSNGECPTITGIWLKRYKVRASSRMYKKMIYNYRWLQSNTIDSSEKYMKAWKCFVKLEGLYNTIEHIEKVTTAKREFIRECIKENKSKFIQDLSPYTKKFNSNYWSSKFYNAYKCNCLEEFYCKNKELIRRK